MTNIIKNTADKVSNTKDKAATSLIGVSESIDSSKISKIIDSFVDDKIKVGAGPLNWLRHKNDQLESVPKTIITYIDTIFNSGEKFSQKGVDMICEYAAWAANISVETIRQQIIKSLYEQYGFMFAIQKKIMWVKEMFTNPLSLLGAVIGVVKSILSLFLGPIAFVIMYMVEVVKEVIRLGENLANIAAVLPPQPPNPSINFNAFKLQLGKMGVSILTDDPAQLPTPKQMFPEPIRPLSPSFWKALNKGTSDGSKAPTTYKEEKPFYKLPDEDFSKNMVNNYFSNQYNLTTTKDEIDNYIQGSK